MNVQRQTEWAQKQDDKFKQELATEAAARRVTQQVPPLPPPNYSPPPLQRSFQSFWENLQHKLPDSAPERPRVMTPPRREAMPHGATMGYIPIVAER